MLQVLLVASDAWEIAENQTLRAPAGNGVQVAVAEFGASAVPDG